MSKFNLSNTKIIADKVTINGVDYDHRLIASAPYLLEALIELIEWDKNYPRGEQFNPIIAEKMENEFEAIILKAKNAIEKATL